MTSWGASIYRRLQTAGVRLLQPRGAPCMQRLEQPLNVGVSVVCMHADTHALCALGDGREAHSACNAPVLLQVRRQLECLGSVQREYWRRREAWCRRGYLPLGQHLS